MLLLPSSCHQNDFHCIFSQHTTRKLLHNYSKKQALRVSSDFDVKSFMQGARLDIKERGKVLHFPQRKLSNSMEAVSISPPLPHSALCEKNTRWQITLSKSIKVTWKYEAL